MLSVTTASGKKLTIQQLSRAEECIRKIAANNKLLLAHHYGTSAEEVEALVELAHECWFNKSKQKGRK